MGKVMRSRAYVSLSFSLSASVCGRVVIFYAYSVLQLLIRNLLGTCDTVYHLEYHECMESIDVIPKQQPIVKQFMEITLLELITELNEKNMAF